MIRFCPFFVLSPNEMAGSLQALRWHQAPSEIWYHALADRQQASHSFPLTLQFE
jgi:hypothetical protein